MTRPLAVALLLGFVAVHASVFAACGGKLDEQRDSRRDASTDGTWDPGDANESDAPSGSRKDASRGDGAVPSRDASADALAEGGDASDAGGYSLGRIKPYAVPHGGDLGWLDGIAVADITGDGRSDVVVLSDLGVYVFGQTADGKLGPPDGYPYALPPGSGNEIAVLDLDRNGALDVVVGHHSGLVIFKSNGAGHLLPGKAVLGRPSGARMRVMDVDRDGIDDVLAIGNANPEFVIWYGDGAGGVREIGSFQPGGPYGPGYTNFTERPVTSG